MYSNTNITNQLADEISANGHYSALLRFNVRICIINQPLRLFDCRLFYEQLE